MSQRPHDLPPEFRFIPHPHNGDPIGMEFLIREIEDADLRNQLTAIRLETAAAALHTMADGVAKAAAAVSARQSAS